MALTRRFKFRNELTKWFFRWVRDGGLRGGPAALVGRALREADGHNEDGPPDAGVSPAARDELGRVLDMLITAYAFGGRLDSLRRTATEPEGPGAWLAGVDLADLILIVASKQIDTNAVATALLQERALDADTPEAD
jgi:hypothetical protein